MADNNQTGQMQWWVKPTSDALTYFENVAASFYEDAKIEMLDYKAVKITWFDVKGYGLSAIIPISVAAAGRNAWDEAIANASGSVLQDLIIGAAAVGLVVFAAPALAATALGGVIIGGVALTVSVISSYSDTGLGNVFENIVKLHKNTLTMKEFLDAGYGFHSTVDKMTVKDFMNNTEYSYDKLNHIASILSTDYETQLFGFKYTVNNFTTVNKFSINNRTLDIRNLSEIELRNAVSHIDKVSFLLSEINIRVGEKLDMGSFGIYTVKGGDTLSQIAASHNMVTKDLVMLNTWLVDDGRIDFLYPTKVLVDAGTIVNSVWFMRSEREVA